MFIPIHSHISPDSIILPLFSLQLKAQVVDAVGSNCHNLETLNVAGLPFVDDLVLSQIAENCQKIDHINLKGCRNVREKILNIQFLFCQISSYIVYFIMVF